MVFELFLFVTSVHVNGDFIPWAAERRAWRDAAWHVKIA
jgi:hypothetical protein